MKKVTDKHTVAHLFANQLQDEARTPTGNLFFEGDNIYSYGKHFKIAKHVTNEQGEKALLLTECRYSNTTSKHISIVWRACNHLNIIQISSLDEYSSDGIFNIWASEGEGCEQKLINAHKPEIYLNKIANLKARVNRYAEFMGYKVPTKLQNILSIESAGQYSNLAAARIAALKAEKLVKTQRVKENLKEDLEKFWNFEVTYLSNPGGFDYLRYNSETNRVETSQRVEIPAETAKKFYKIVLDTIAKGGCSNCGIRLMEQYQVNEINKKFIRVGCHKIEISEIKRLTTSLNW